MKIATPITAECESSPVVAELENLARTRQLRDDGDRP